MSLATISAFNLGFSWPTNFGTSGILKIISTKTFVSSGLTYPSGRTSDPVNQNFCVQANISVAGSIATVASFQLPQTDATDVTIINGSGVPLYVGIIYSNAGTTKQRILFENWHLSSSLTTSFSFAAWTVDNAASGIVNPPTVYLNSDEVQNAITARLNSAASTSALGLVKISVTPADTANPIAVGKNDYASTSNLGIGKISVAPASASSPIFVGDNDPRLLTSTGTLTSTGAILIGADTDASGTDGITLQTRGITRLAIANSGAVAFTNTPYFTIAATNSAGQTFTQIDQNPPNTPFPAYAGTVETITNVLSANQFGHVVRLTAGLDLVANLPAGQLVGYKVPLLTEVRTTAGLAGDFTVTAANHVGEVNAGWLGPMAVFELDGNQGAVASPSTAIASPFTNGHSTMAVIVSGGSYQINTGIRFLATTASNKFIRPLEIFSDAYTFRAIEIGKAGGTNSSLGAELAIKHIGSRSAILIESDSTTTGNAFNVLDSAGSSSLASLSITGEYLSTVGYKTTGTASKFYVVNGEGFELWKDATPSTAWDMGNRVPGGAVTDDIIFSYFGGASWAEKFRVNATDVYGKGMTSLQWLKDATPTKAFAIGNNVPGSAVGDDYVLSIYNGSTWTGRMRVAQNGDTVLGATAALATSATAGFVFLPSCAGAATGTPAGSYTGMLPMVVDSTNFKIYINFGGTWKSVTLT